MSIEEKSIPSGYPGIRRFMGDHQPFASMSDAELEKAAVEEDGGDPSISKFGLRILDIVLRGLEVDGRGADEQRVLHYIRVGIGSLLDVAIKKWMPENHEAKGQWAEKAGAGYVMDAKTSPVDALAAVYLGQIDKGAKPDDLIDWMIALHRHPREHYFVMANVAGHIMTFLKPAPKPEDSTT